MRKKGSVLATVLITSSILLILGTAVSASVINTTKLNKKYSDTIDLELAAKSALNYGINYITNNYENMSFPFYQKDILVNEDNIVKSVKIEKLVNNQFTVKGIAEYGSSSSEESKIVTVSNPNNESNNGSNSENNNGSGETDNSGEVKPPENTIPNEPDDSESTGETLVFDKLFNIGGNIKSFGNNNQNSIEYFQYSGTCDLGGNNNKYDSNGNKILPQRNEDLGNLNLSINSNKILQYISKYSNEDIKNHNSESITANNTTIKYNQLNGNNSNISLNSSKVLFANGGSSQNSNSIEVIGASDNNSELIFGGSTTFNTGMNIKKLEYSKIIVNGDLNVWNGPLKIENANNSVFIINGNLKNSGSGIDINLKNSILIVAGDIEPQNNFKLTLENSAIICLGNLKLNTQINIYNNGNSFIYCGEDFSCNSEIKIYTNNGGYTPNSSVVNNTIADFISNK